MNQKKARLLRKKADEYFLKTTGKTRPRKSEEDNWGKWKSGYELLKRFFLQGTLKV